MDRRSFRVIEGGASAISNLSAEMSPDLTRRLAAWFFGEIDDVPIAAATQLLERRLTTLCELTERLNDSVGVGVHAAAIVCRQQDIHAVFVNALQDAHAKLLRDLPADDE